MQTVAGVLLQPALEEVEVVDEVDVTDEEVATTLFRTPSTFLSCDAMGLHVAKPKRARSIIVGGIMEQVSRNLKR